MPSAGLVHWSNSGWCYVVHNIWVVDCGFVLCNYVGLIFTSFE